jgi:hypothetical protein
VIFFVLLPCFILVTEVSTHSLAFTEQGLHFLNHICSLFYLVLLEVGSIHEISKYFFGNVFLFAAVQMVTLKHEILEIPGHLLILFSRV